MEETRDLAAVVDLEAADSAEKEVAEEDLAEGYGCYFSFSTYCSYYFYFRALMAEAGSAPAMTNLLVLAAVVGVAAVSIAAAMVICRENARNLVSSCDVKNYIFANEIDYFRQGAS